MSLDFYLYYPTTDSDEDREDVYSANITHNLGTMAKEADLYIALWHPEELIATRARHISNILERGLAELESRSSYYSQFDAKNSWGKYEHFVLFVRQVLDACKEHPNARIRVSI